MKAYLLVAPRTLTPHIPEGFMIQVISCRTGNQPDASEVREAMIRAGITDSFDLSWCGPGNSTRKELKP